MSRLNLTLPPKTSPVCVTQTKWPPANPARFNPGSPWENEYIESFNARLRDQLLNEKILYTLKEAQVLIEAWRCHHNTIRPHGSLGCRPPAPGTVIPASWPPGSATFLWPPTLPEKPAVH